MRRRDFIKVIAGSGAAWPLAANAQSSKRFRQIGILMGVYENDPEGQRWARAVLGALQELGWTRDKNAQIRTHWASHPNEVERFSKELVKWHPDVIHVTTTTATSAILRETRSIPVVFSIVSDPLGNGFVQSLRRPGRNATGFINIESSVAGKWLELLKELAPRVSRLAMLFNPATAPQTPYYRGLLEEAAPRVGITLTAAPVNDTTDIEKTIAALAQDSTSGLIALPDLFLYFSRDLITSLAARHRVPAIYPFQFFVRAGGLVSYGADLAEQERRSANYIDRILKGESPAELPVQPPAKFELAINLQAAKALGLEVSPALLARAAEVIQ